MTRPVKQPHNYEKSPFSMGKSTISMVIFNSYVTNDQAGYHQKEMIFIPKHHPSEEGPILVGCDGLVFNVWRSSHFYAPGVFDEPQWRCMEHGKIDGKRCKAYSSYLVVIAT
jgi:hypothetical protein